MCIVCWSNYWCNLCLLTWMFVNTLEIWLTETVLIKKMLRWNFTRKFEQGFKIAAEISVNSVALRKLYYQSKTAFFLSSQESRNRIGKITPQYQMIHWSDLSPRKFNCVCVAWFSVCSFSSTASTEQTSPLATSKPGLSN